MLRETYNRLIDKVTEETRSHYGDRLISVVLYGSVARGTMRPDSDIDLLIVATPLPHGRMARMREFEGIDEAIASDLKAAARMGVRTDLSPIIKTPEEVGYGSPLFLDMTLEARILFDRDGFFGRYLQGLKQRLQDLGSQRKQLAGGYYWVLKPDWKPGEEIRL